MHKSNEHKLSLIYWVLFYCSPVVLIHPDEWSWHLFQLRPSVFSVFVLILTLVLPAHPDVFTHTTSNLPQERGGYHAFSAPFTSPSLFTYTPYVSHSPWVFPSTYLQWRGRQWQSSQTVIYSVGLNGLTGGVMGICWQRCVSGHSEGDLSLCRMRHNLPILSSDILLFGILHSFIVGKLQRSEPQILGADCQEYLESISAH